MRVRPKKHLGQHFLKDEGIASRIVDALDPVDEAGTILEIGPGMGILTDILLKKYPEKTRVVDIDPESVAFLKKKYSGHEDSIWQGDFLKMDLSGVDENKLAIIGNFPYNISSQIMFRIFEQRDQVVGMVGMFQKEVGERIASPPGNRTYGILSVLLGAFYHIEYLFHVEPGVFHPPPRVRSGVIRLRRNAVGNLPCDESFFVKIVKQGFQKRRKTLRNALKGLNLPGSINKNPLLDKRAEQLSVGDFIELTSEIEWQRKK